MSVEKKDFYGKEVTDAIKSACEAMGVSQEQLDIEVIETGSTGIFGLIRKKAKIRVSLKVDEQPEVEAEQPPAVEQPDEEEPVVDEQPASASAPEPQIEEEEPKTSGAAEPEAVEETDDSDDSSDDEDDEEEGETDPFADEVDASAESVEIVRQEIVSLVGLMGYPSSVEVQVKGLSLNCTISGEHEEQLAGPEGKTLDSIQYLVRKMVARKCSERLRISVNVGTFREKRLEELIARAVELAKRVRETGKTHVLPALNPSERREIHMVLQEDKEVRSRSVGDGLFKKILIYKPGKGSRGGRRKGGPRGRKPRGNRGPKGSSEE